MNKRNPPADYLAEGFYLFGCFLFGLLFGFPVFVVIRVNHDLLNFGIGCICADKSADREEKDKGKNDAKRDKHGKECVIDCTNQNDPEYCHDITLDPENGKKKCVFEQLKDAQIKGDHHEINIHSHHKINNAHGKNHEKENVR